MKIALYSDLHREASRVPFEPPELDVDVVILAGDISSHTNGLKWAANTFSKWHGKPKVVYVTGNHEYYDAHLGLLSEMRKPVWKEKGISFLEKDVLEIHGVRILGCTLWSAFDLHGKDTVESAMKSARNGINDYWMIYGGEGKRLEPYATRELHKEAVRWLDAELAKPFDGKTIVVTHFAPHRGCIAPQHQNSEFSPYFVTDLSWLMQKHRINIWCHGHTHTNNDFVAENHCRIVSNQRGYPKEVESGMMQFDERLILTVG